jgi:hypothetical protein
MAYDRWKSRLQVRWLVTAAGAFAMMIIVLVLAWNVVTSPHPIEQLATSIAPSEGEPQDCARAATNGEAGSCRQSLQ